MRVPVVARAAAPVAADAAAASGRVETSARRLRVLVIDDNVDGACTMAMLVTMLGHETCVAHDGGEALSQLAMFSPHLVFCDIGLPGLDGYEVARRVRAVEAARGGGRTLLVSLTGWGSEDDKRWSREAGFDFHLTKPVESSEVEALLTRTAKALAAAGLAD